MQIEGEADAPSGLPRGDEPGAALDALLRERAGAVVAALGDGARVVPMPASVPLAGQRVFEDGLGLDLVVAQDQIAIIAAWGRAQYEPVVRLEVHLLADPDHVSTLHLFDVRAEHGAHVVVIEAEDQELLLRSLDGRIAPRGRVARARKDATAVFLEVDEATTALLGWAVADLVGHSTVEFVHPEDVGRAIENWMAVRDGEDGGRLRVRYRHADGHHLWLEVTNHNRLEDPDLGCVVSEMVDISAEMAQVEALRDRERLLARLADALPIGICHLRPDLQVVYSNAPLVALLGPVDSIEALLDSVVAADRDQVRTALDNAFQGDPTTLELGVAGRAEERRCELSFRSMTTDAGTIDGVIVCATDVTDRCRLRAELEHRAWHDPLTGCFNRAAAVVALERALREAEHVALAYVDLDDFKAINDEFGHATGDELLKVAAARLRVVTRASDRLARLGGDEFVVICRQGDVPFDRAALVERLRDAIDGDVVVGGRRIPLSASVGVAIAGNGERDAEAVLHRADMAMYRVKRRSRTGAPPPPAPDVPPTEWVSGSS